MGCSWVTSFIIWHCGDHYKGVSLLMAPICNLPGSHCTLVTICPKGRLYWFCCYNRCSNVSNSCSVFLIIRLVGLAVYAQDPAHPAGPPLMSGSVGRVPGWNALGLNPVQCSRGLLYSSLFCFGCVPSFFILCTI